MEQSSENRLRHVVIGVAAAVLTEHVPALALPTVEVVAVSDINVEKGKQRADQLHCAFYQDYHILHGASSYSDGVQGRMALELANAMTYSSYKGCQVEFPLDRQSYANLLKELIQQHSKKGEQSPIH